MDFWHSAAGMVELSVISANPADSLSALNQSGIQIFELQNDVDPLKIHFTIFRQDYKKIQKLLQKRGDDLKIRRKKGIYWTAKGLLKRPVLLIGILFFIILITFVPSRIYFVRVEGNVHVPTKKILQMCESSGISFGASRRSVRSEKVKNRLLEFIPELQWAGVNTSGCVAIVSVREREEMESAKENEGITRLVALRDGVITDLNVTSGNSICKVGQSVRAGETLISGYTDCGISIRAEKSSGEIYADTSRNLQITLPEMTGKKERILKQIKNYAILIGKKRINLYKDSGIYDDSCDKMYVENYLTLPGGFVLPLAIVTETITTHEIAVPAANIEDAKGILISYRKDYLSGQMIAGKVLSEQESIIQAEDAYILSGKYACNEMIAISQNEEIIKPYGKHD